ncbi:MAG: MFS transporter [Betaproteobacteria bacterium]|nr:MAG: MFS transporter [Betaproteobacteria bacterium]
MADSAVSFPALRRPVFRAYFFGAASAMMADSIEHVISYWIMYQKFASPALAGFAVISHWVPFLLFSIWSGGLADRHDPRRVIQLGMLLFMSVSVAWGLLFLADALEMWHAGVLLVVHGLAGVLWGPAAQVFIHDIVEEADLHSAIRLTATARWLGLLLGPAVGGVILMALGPAWGILFNALIYVPFALWLWKAPYARKVIAPERRVRALADVASTWRAVAHNRVITSMTLLAGGASFIVGNAYQAQMPEFAHDLGHGGGGLTYSMLFGADAAGALLGGLALESRGLLPPKPRSAFLLAGAWCLAIGGFAATRSYGLALALLFAAGFLELAFFAMAQTLVQLHAPAPVRGRVIGLFAMSALGLRAFSGVTVGLAGSLIGIHLSLALSAALLLALIIVMLWTLIPSR